MTDVCQSRGFVNLKGITFSSSFSSAVSQILDSLEETQWLTIADRLDFEFIQKLFDDQQLRNLLEVKRKTSFRFLFVNFQFDF